MSKPAFLLFSLSPLGDRAARRRVLHGAAVLTALAAILAATPLFGLLGYEFSAAIALAASFLAAWIGARASSTREALLGAEAMLLPPLVLITLNALRVRNCDYLAGLRFYALLPVLSVVCAVATGRLCARIFRRPLLVAFLVIVGSLGWGVLRFYRSPILFGFDPFLGYYPGALYDEEILLPTAFFWARAMHLLGAAGVLLLLTQRRVGVVLVAAALVLFALRGRLAIAPDADDIARALGGRYETPHFTILYAPGSATSRDLERIGADHEFRYAQLERATGVTPPRIRSFLFPSPAVKRKWTGASQTFIAKPWRNEIYLHEEPFPHPVLKHELAHVFAGTFGDPFLHLPFRYLPPRMSIGLLEGVAVALDWHGGPGLSPAGTARALGLLAMRPSLGSLFGVGFYQSAAPRAYTVAGAFCRFLLETRGRDKLFAAYRAAGDFERIYGVPLSTLEQEWIRWLERYPVTSGDVERVGEALRRPAIWHKVCAHALAELRQRAQTARERGDLATAGRCLERVAADDPDEPQNGLALAELQSERGEREQALATARGLLEHPKLSTTLRAQVLDLVGDLAWRAGKIADATAAWQKVLTLPTDEARERGARAKLTMADDPRLHEPLGRYFFREPGRPGGLALFFAELAAERAPERGLGHYLLGRSLLQLDERSYAIPPIERALTLGLPHPVIEREAVRLLALAAHGLGDRAGAARHFRALLERPDLGEGPRLEIADWLQRIAWEEARK